MQTNMNNKNEQGLNVVDLFLYLLSKWKWFLLSVVFCGGLAWIQYARMPRIFFSQATVVIKDPSNKTSSAGLDRYDNYINKVNVANELLQFRSKRLMREVINRLQADVDYLKPDGLRHDELYTQSPVKVTFPDALPNQRITLTVVPKDEKTVLLSSTGPEGEDKTVEAPLSDTVTVWGCRLVVTPTHTYGKNWYRQPVGVRKNALNAVVARYRSSLGIRQEEDESSILTLSLKDFSAARAADVLNMLVTVYNEEAIKDKNQVAVNTADFINERLLIISDELGSVESDLESFKRENQVVDINSSASMYMDESRKYNADVLELETQFRLARYIKEYLTDPHKDTDLIPANTGISDMNIETQISQYNAAKLKRDRLLDDSSESNPIVKELNNSLHALKQSIIRAVDNLIVSINVKRSDVQAREQRAQSRVAVIPTKQREMLTIERQQKIKESLYLFLLNRREENALSQAMADNNARVIDEAEISGGPISPRRNHILLLGVLIGLAIPGTVFLMILFLDTRIHGRKDLVGAVSVPFLGEIPLESQSKKKDKHPSYGYGDDIVAEAFRILRTNMAFMAKKGRAMQVITFTSFNPGAGKTFISHNLAQSYVYAKKRVVLLDLDIRKGTLSRRLGQHVEGVTNFLADPSISVDAIIQHTDTFDLIASGSVPPNPAELLMDSRLDELVNELRSRYDYIIVDNVPVGVVADAAIANRIADLTVFVVRAGRLDRRQLPDIEQLYTDKTLNNMALVLNGSAPHYGYRYGYGYGYGNYGKKKR